MTDATRFSRVRSILLVLAASTGGFACGEVSSGATAPGGAGPVPTTGGGGAATNGSGGATTGGTTASPTGGSVSATGGNGVAGASAGSVNMPGGGSTASGGVAATTGGSAVAGDSGTSGGGSTTPDPVPSSGCGAASWPESGEYSIEIQGKMREYIVTVPEDYAGTTPMRLIFVYHGLTGTAQGTAGNGMGGFGYFGIQRVSDGSAILVAPQGLPSEEGMTDYAWRNENDEDTEFARAMMERFMSEYCIDSTRIFVAGMSYGGVASNDIGCDVGDLVRAIAPIAGAGPGFGNFGGGGPACMGQVAALLIHGTADETVDFASGEASRDHWLEANGCGAETSVVTNEACADYEGCECVAYAGCQADLPVEFCSHPDGHTIPSFSAQTIWDFFLRF